MLNGHWRTSLAVLGLTAAVAGAAARAQVPEPIWRALIGQKIIAERQDGSEFRGKLISVEPDTVVLLKNDGRPFAVKRSEVKFIRALQRAHASHALPTEATAIAPSNGQPITQSPGPIASQSVPLPMATSVAAAPALLIPIAARAEQQPLSPSALTSTHVAAPPTSTTPRPATLVTASLERPNQMFLNAKIGAAVSAVDIPSYIATELEFGRRVRPGLWLIAPLAFQGGNGIVLSIPIGIQYEFAIAAVPGLVIYPRMTIGYALHRNPSFNLGIFGSTSATYTHYLAAEPGLGLKYQLSSRWHIGVEPLRLPMYINDSGLGLQYSLLFYGGMSF